MAAGGKALFGEAGTFLKGVAEEVEGVKKLIASEDQKRRQEIEALQRDHEQERFEAREDLYRLRCEFEEFARQRIDAVMQQVNEMNQQGAKGNTGQSDRLEALIMDFDRMKENMFMVQSSWGKLISTCVDPAESSRRSSAAVDEKRVAMPTLSPGHGKLSSKQLLDHTMPPSRIGSQASPGSPAKSCRTSATDLQRVSQSPRSRPG